MIFVTNPATNDKNGNGRYTGLRNRKRGKKASAEKSQEFKYLSSQDLTMKFSNTKDPIYYAFECLEKRSVIQLMGDFVKDSIFEVTNIFS